ncbi:NADH:flavin oxidoreductase/NADH oxidase, partial [Cylindrobasidium torrendii FP15055 ss-10]
MSTQTPKLFQPIRVGNMDLQHRIVLPPMTRYKASRTHVPATSLVSQYYAQRAHTPGTLLITEATLIAPEAGGYRHTPGIWNDEQVEAWKPVADAVHVKGSYVFMQLWALGHSADPSVLEEEGGYPYVSASAVATGTPATPRPTPGVQDPDLSKTLKPAPRALSVEEIAQYVQWYAQAAKNAIRAGFDGVEIHGAFGYLPDQFLRSATNKRTDVYGGSVENRIRFPLEIIEAVSRAIGQERLAYRITPWYPVLGVDTGDSIETFSAFVSTVKTRFPRLAFLDIIEPRPTIDGKLAEGKSNDFLHEVLKNSDIRVMSAGGYLAESALKIAEEKGYLIGIGKWYIANPDIVYRIKEGIPLTEAIVETFYTPGNVAEGYIDYPFA